MQKIIITLKDWVKCNIQGLTSNDKAMLTNEFKAFVPSARFTPLYKTGRWDGYLRFFEFTGNTYVNLLPEILSKIDLSKYDSVEYLTSEDLTKDIDLGNDIDESFMSDITWYKGHRLEGQPVMLEDHQVRVVNALLHNHRAVISSATGSGKCVSYETLINIISKNDVFKAYLDNRTIQIGKLYDNICDYLHIQGEYEKEIDVKELGLTVDGVDGQTNVNYIIKKHCNGLKLLFENGGELICAKKHILYKDGKDIHAQDLEINDLIDVKNGTLKIIGIEDSDIEDYYDISVDYPHIYYDANGVKHHNTLISACLFKKVIPHGRAVIIVPSKDLATQSADEYRKWGLDTGIVGCGLREFGHDVTVCTWQTINSMEKRKKKEDSLTGEELIKLTENVVCVIFDETHLVKGNEVKRVMEQTFRKVPIRWGLTGTINKDKCDQLTLQTAVGSIIDEKITAKELQDKGFLSNCRINCVRLEDKTICMDYQSEVEYLCSNDDRLNFIATLISQITQQQNNTLVLIGRISFGEHLEKKILEKGVDAIFLNGSVKSKKRFEEYDSIKTQNNRCLICTDKIASTGLNLPRIFNLVFIDFGKSFTKTIQSIGRGLRKASDKDFVNIFDISSTTRFSKKHFNDRIHFYEDAGYQYQVLEIKNWKK